MDVTIISVGARNYLNTMLCITLPSVDQILTRLSKDPVASHVPLSLSLATTKLVIPAS